MKSVLVVFGLLTMAMVANAQEKAAGLPVELCKLESYDDADAEAFVEVENVDVKAATSLSAFQLDLVNQHLIEREYTPKALTLAEIQALFSGNGEERYNELYLVTLKAKESGNTYIQAFSYPGDNQYGLIFEAKTGKLVGHNGDGSISLYKQNGSTVSCYDLGFNN